MATLTQAVKNIPPGRYIVAISGGVDSMAFLHALSSCDQLELVVAHVNHGIRDDSNLDAELVERFCRSHNIDYRLQELYLGSGISEDAARIARYNFLQTCLIKERASAILTAHHQDDLLETVIINLLRGTGWRGIAPFAVNSMVLRPLLELTKSQLVAHAAANSVPFREDSTNTDQRYLRNYVRLSVMPMLDAKNSEWRNKLLRLIRKQMLLRRTIEVELDSCITWYARANGDTTVSQRYIWCMLPPAEGYALLQQLCRKAVGHSLVKELAESALIFAKVAKPGKKMPLNNSWQLRVTLRDLIVEPRSSVLK